MLPCLHIKFGFRFERTQLNPTFSIYLLCMNIYVYICVDADAHACSCQVSFSKGSSPVLWDKVSQWIWSSSIQLGWLNKELQGSGSLCQQVLRHQLPYPGFWLGSERRPSWLHNGKFTDLTNTPALTSHIFWPEFPIFW